jgi:hypothetical protein
MNNETTSKKSKKMWVFLFILISLLISGRIVYRNFMPISIDHPIDGGECHYNKIPGKCLIKNIKDTSVIFDFTPNNPVVLEREFERDIVESEKHSAYIGYLGLSCLKDEMGSRKYPIDDGVIEKCGLKAGEIFDCEIHIAKGGPCSPVNYNFFDQN